MKPYFSTVMQLINELKCERVLDIPAGNGWLTENLKCTASIDGLDLNTSNAAKYNQFFCHNFNHALPIDNEFYDCVVSCEGIEHMGNPLLFLEESFRILRPGGTIIITTPNIWYPGARLKYLFTGFFPSFPAIVDGYQELNHKHIIPWSPPQLYLFLKLAGFTEVRAHYRDEVSPKHRWESIFGKLMSLPARRKLGKATTRQSMDFWSVACHKQGLFGRGLIFSASKQIHLKTAKLGS